MNDIRRPRQPVYLAVATHDSETGHVEQQRIINHDNQTDRIWLGKHCFWAFRNGKAVTTSPVESADAEMPEWF